MKELMEYRVKIVARLGGAAREFCAACKAVSDPFSIVEGEWTLHQIASHTRDVDKLIYGARIRQTLHEDNPEFQNFDADSWMSARYNKEEPLTKILDEFLTNMEDLCQTLSKMPHEGWSRESHHETIGNGLTLQLWVERSLAHVEEHLQALKKG
jgi:hypothetical protein